METSSSLQVSKATMTAEDRRRLRQERKKEKKTIDTAQQPTGDTDERFAKLLSKNEDQLLEFVAKVNKVYEQKLKKDAPFMTFVLCGMQSSGKSTIMERFMNAVLNIVQEGTGTRCPLDTTCIHDDNMDSPSCDLRGDEIPTGEDLSVDEVFKRITMHNKKLAEEDRFSTKPLRLVYRSKDVQNMRFVDCPGIISNKSTGNDNREEIKNIISMELERPNSKLCVLLEATEFAKNPVIEFLDTSLGGRQKWINNATFLMTKFDKQTHDSRSAGKANNFFKEFLENEIYPHCVITPTLPKEDLEPEKLYSERMALLDRADKEEQDAFRRWLGEHEVFRQTDYDKAVLDERISSRLGFESAKTAMREIMLQDTARRLPEVLCDLRIELSLREKEQQRLLDMQKFNDPQELKTVVGLLLSEIDQRLHCYLDGDLETSLKFPWLMQTLDDEIEEEEDSEWAMKDLNHYTDRENHWRDRISKLGEYPEEVQPERRFLGGKQYHRAMDFFHAVMIDALPDPFELEQLVPNVTGYLSGGLQRENWERATVEIVRTCLKDISHPGINFLVKHVGQIFRRLFYVALEDIRHGEELSSMFQLLPRNVESYLNQHFDDVLWKLMKNAAEKTHLAIEPMYSTVNPNLPTFHPTDFDENATNESAKESYLKKMVNRFESLVIGSGSEARRYLKEESRMRAKSKRAFLCDERTAMITNEETNKILHRSFEYIIGLIEWNLVNLRFQIDHYLFMEFKSTMKRSFVYELMTNTNWEELVEPDKETAQRLIEVDDEIKSLKESLQEVQHMNRRF
ncbi:dynamin family protein [Nitzschia inconspicua]|uniref:Dynamin family protein n=1 Tax=Nitzschia inconspicua TaxID=303405 RepID=A0A9K3PG62_9STRA|nr:dynamin family protein [Nitzschia inconspicua]